MKVERDVFADMPINDQMLVIYDNLEAMSKRLKYKIGFYATIGGLFGGAFAIIGNWSFWGKITGGN